MIRCIGFVLIVAGASSAGIWMASRVNQELKCYRALLSALISMQSEIRCNCSTVVYASEKASERIPAPVSDILRSISTKLKDDPTVSPGLHAHCVLRRMHEIPSEMRDIMRELFSLLGRQDLAAQLRALDLAVSRTECEINKLLSDRPDRCRTYRIMGICGGLAIAVILL